MKSESGFSFAMASQPFENCNIFQKGSYTLDKGAHQILFIYLFIYYKSSCDITLV